MNDIVAPIVRRAILDLLNDAGGEQNHDVIALYLGQLGHRIARRDVREQLLWLSTNGLVVAEELGPFVVARITSDGRDLADGKLHVEGVSKFKTGE